MTGAIVEATQAVSTTDGIVLGSMSVFIQALPTMILILTNKIKTSSNRIGKFIWLVPIVLGIIGMVFASFAYGEIGLLVAIGSGLWAGVLAIISYDQTKGYVTKNLEPKTVPNEIGYVDKD